MIYHLTEFLSQFFDIPGSGVIKYLSFRAGMAIIFSIAIGMIFGLKLIKMLRRKQIGEDIRDLGLQGQLEKRGTPTMGGIIILGSILVSVLLFADLTNVYIQLMIASTIWLGALGFADDYIKVFRKNKAGLKGKFKVIGQVGLGLIVGMTMWMSDSIDVRQKSEPSRDAIIEQADVVRQQKSIYWSEPEKSTKTTIPFVKNNELDYADLLPDGPMHDTAGWVLYVVVAIFIITAVSNGANLTDGLDGLAAGVSAIIGAVLGILAYLSGNVIYADYLNIMNIPGSGELLVFAAAFVGALLGFLWYNTFPAQVFMGDTGSLAIGGIIAVFALLIRKELLLPILCGVFLVESLSVMIQVGYFKYTKRKYGEGRRVFLMSPLHHHFQKKGTFESKIVMRFWIIQLILAAVAVITLKIR